MDLYGDLPPTSEGADGLVSKGGWAIISNSNEDSQSNSSQNKKTTSDDASRKTDTKIGSSYPTLMKPMQLKPNQLKPRQMSNPSSQASKVTATTTIITSTAPSSSLNINVSKPLSFSISSESKDNSNNSNNIMEGDENHLISSGSQHISLNFECEDEYDPRRPNDYIKWCEERLEIKRQEKIAEENALVIEEQNKLRLQRETERALAAERGDVQKLQEMMTMTSGRGRGRGVSNLPSWMTDGTSMGKLSSNSESEDKNNMTSDYDTKRFEDSEDRIRKNMITTTGTGVGTSSKVMKPSKVILITNMVHPEEVDDSLIPETSMECSKFGSVKSCNLFEVKDEYYPLELRIRVFVQFETLQSAAEAYRSLNGRFFGGRTITVSFYDEKLYEIRDLAPK